MIGVRWTIGDVNPRGFDALRLSLWGAWRIFGRDAGYRVYVNSVELERARDLTGIVPPAVEWRAAERELPDWLSQKLGAGMAEGVAWKFAPMRAFPEAHEIALDNDVVLWRRPAALEQWLAGASDFVLARDVAPYFGAFESACPEFGVNTGIRGLPPGFDLGAALRPWLERRPAPLLREVDEQGLQVATLVHAGRVATVDLEDVTICSPFPPHVPHLGRAGAHFVGLNTRRLGFEYYGRPAEAVRAEHWDAWLPELARRVQSPESSG